MNELKAKLRGEMIARRDALPQTERDRIAQSLVGVLAAMPQFTAARAVLATMAIGSEWSTRALLDRAVAARKTVVLPRLTPQRRLALHSVSDLDRHLVPGVWKIPEPDPDRCPEFAIQDVDFALVPALAADLAGFRLGYGAGYFDKLLATRGARPFCVTALPAGFIVDSLPHEPHDVAVDVVVDERGPVGGAMRAR